MTNRRVLAILIALGLVFTATASWAKGSTETAVKTVPEVYIWPQVGTVTAQGTPKAKLEAIQKHLIEKTGIKPIGMPTDYYSTENQTKLNLILASRQQRIDVFSGNWPEYVDVALPLNDLLTKYGPNILKAFSKEAMLACTDKDGKIIGIPRLGVMGHTQFTWFQEDLLKKAGIAIPTTWAEIEPALLAMRKVNPNAMILTSSTNDFMRCWLGAFTKTGFANWLDANGKVQLFVTADGFKTFVATMADWYRKGYFFKETFIKHDDTEVLKSGNVGIFAGWYSRITILYSRLLAAGGVTAKYVMPDRILGPNGPIATDNVSNTNAIMISKNCPDPAAAVKFLNWQYDTDHPENVVTANYGVEGTDWAWVNPKEKYLFNQLTKDYQGEFMASAGLATDVLLAPNTPELLSHYTTIRKYALNLSNGILPFDATVAYDGKELKNRAPAVDDINRMVSEQVVQFIMGARPMGDWDAFLGELKKAGYDSVVEENTRQYNLLKKK